MSYYAVRIGKVPGIYLTWDECKKNVIGFNGAVYRKFETEEEANEFMAVEVPIVSIEDIMKLPAFAFVDGSFNAKESKVGSAGFIVTTDDGKIKSRFISLESVECDSDMLSMRNVAGEVIAAKRCIAAAIKADIKDLTIIYDYQGIEAWATGLWKANKSGTKDYQKYCFSVKDKITLHYIKVNGHCNIIGNEIADRLAKFSSGVMTGEDVYSDVVKLDTENFIDKDVIKYVLGIAVTDEAE